MRVFFDTSAFIKRYIEEPGTQKVIDMCRQAESLVLSVICLPEMLSTLNRLVREGKISLTEYEQTRNLILKDLEDAEICNLTPDVIKRTLGCLENNPLRALDGLNLSCALMVNPDVFVSSDQRQIEAARKEGLTTLEA